MDKIKYFFLVQEAVSLIYIYIYITIGKKRLWNYLFHADFTD